MTTNVVKEDLYPCKDCGRTFREEVIKKHEKICKKVFKSKRKKFDTKKKRILDSEHAMIIKYAEKENKMNSAKIEQVKQRKKFNWKKQSEVLRSAARANRSMNPGKMSYQVNVPSKGKGVSNYGASSYGASNHSNKGNYGKQQQQMYSKETSASSYSNKGNYGKQQQQIYTKETVTNNNNYDDFVNCNYCGRSYNEEAYNKHLGHCSKKYKETQIKDKLVKPQLGGSRQMLRKY